MKKYISLSLLLLSVVCFAQKVDYNFIILKFKMPPVYPLPAGATYRTNFHYNLKYNDANPGGATQLHFCDGAPTIGNNRLCKSIKTPLLPLDAKYLNTGDADYTFELDFQGLMIGDSMFRKSMDVDFKLGVHDFSQFNTDYVMYWEYKMPANLMIRKKGGDILGVLPIIGPDIRFNTIVHKYYFINAAYKDFGQQGLPADLQNDHHLGTEVGFENVNQFNRFMNDYRWQILKREEAIHANEVFDSVEKILRTSYGSVDFSSQLQFGRIKSKKDDVTYADLDTAFAYISNSAEDLRKGKTTYDNMLKQWGAARTLYQNALNNNPARLTDDIKNMLYLNLAYLNIFLEDFEQGDKYIAMHKEGMLGTHRSGYSYHRSLLFFRKNCPRLFIPE